MKKTFQKQRNNRLNEEITNTCSEVRILNDDGTSEVISSSKALLLADEQEVDLVEISSNQNPPICKIIEYSKYLFKQEKSKKEQKVMRLKEIKFTAVIGENDITYRVKNMKEFLSDGHKVKVTMVYKGRTITHAEIGKDKLKEILEQVKEYGTPQSEPKFEGKYLITYLNPIKK